MARSVYYATQDSYVLAIGGLPQAGIPVKVWTRPVGGTRITDLVYVNADGSLGSAVPSGILISDGNGLIPAFAGPDGGQTTVFADHGFSGERLALTCDPSGTGGGGGGSGVPADGSLTTAKYQDGSVTALKVAPDVATQAELDAETAARVSADALKADAAATTTALATKADAAATTTALSGKASTTHASTHTAAGSDPLTLSQAQVTGLTAGLAAKADLVGGLVPSAQIPPVAITDTYVVASQAAMLALTAQHGDIAIRTDNSKTYILRTDSPTTLADWVEILSPGAIVSVAGKVGVVALAGEDLTSGTVPFARLPVGTTSTTVAVGNDPRLSDTRIPTDGTVTLAKLAFDPATQTELDAVAAAKADKTTTITAGTGLTGGGDLTTNRTLAVAYGTSAGTAAQGNDTRIVGAAADSLVVHLAGAETITGVKAHTVSPTVPTPTTSTQVASKGYVDTQDAAALTAADTKYAAKAGAVYTGTHNFTGATVTGIGGVASSDPTIYAADYGVVGDSNGTTGNGTDNTTAMRAAYAAVIALTTSVTGQNWVYPKLVLPPGVIRVTDWIVNSPDAAGGTQIPVRGLEWEGCGRRATEVFFDRAGTTTEDPRLNILFVLGNRAVGWAFRRMSFRSLDVDNSCFYFWCRDTDDSALVFPEYGKGAQSDFLYEEVEWRGQWKRVIGWAGDSQANLNSEFRFHACALTVDATAADAFFHLGMPMYGAVHMRVTGSATGGTYTITVGANTTSAIAYNATAATIQTALTGLASVGASNATVTAVSDGFILRFLNAAESIDTTTVTATASLTGGSSPAIVMFRRPIQQSQFLNYWFTECRFEVGGGTVLRVGRGGNINCISGSWIGAGSGATTFFRLEDEPSHAESTCRLFVQGVRFEIRDADHILIDSSWNKGYITFDSCMDSAYSFQSFATTLAAHKYDFTTQGLSRGPQIVYRNCELIGFHQFTTHASTAVTGGSVSYQDCRTMNNTVATGTASGLVRYTGVPMPYEVSHLHGSSLTRIAGASFALNAAVQSTTIGSIVKLTQSAYDAIGTPDASTLYVIVG